MKSSAHKTYIYKIFRLSEWEALCRDGHSCGAPIDLSDGYIHFSNAAQVEHTAAKHFSQQDDLILAACDAADLGEALKWEVSRGGALFPHLYRKLARKEVIWHAPLPLGPHGHMFPNIPPNISQSSH